MSSGLGRKAGYERNKFKVIFIIAVKITTTKKWKHCEDEVNNKIDRFRSYMNKCKHFKSFEHHEKNTNLSLLKINGNDNLINFHDERFNNINILFIIKKCINFF